MTFSTRDIVLSRDTDIVMYHTKNLTSGNKKKFKKIKKI